MEWVPVCPEVEAGFGTPRESMRLVLTEPQVRERGERFDAAKIRLILNKQGTDVTARLTTYAKKKVERLADANLSGFVGPYTIGLLNGSSGTFRSGRLLLMAFVTFMGMVLALRVRHAHLLKKDRKSTRLNSSHRT